MNAPTQLVLEGVPLPATQIIVGDARVALRALPAASVNCCLTSPPYFGLRDYEHGDQIGLEDSPDSYVANIVNVMREVRRVLRDDGTLWIVIGDTYVGGRNGGMGKSGLTSGCNHEAARKAWEARPSGTHRVIAGLKPKDLIGIPWKVAFALRDDGWYLRSDIIWSKPNPMPSSVVDRPSSSHEYVFLLSKRERYYFDYEAIKEPATSERSSGNGYVRAARRSHRDRTTGKPRGSDSRWIKAGMRRKRSVWTIATQPYHGNLRATFPPDLVTPIVLAGCPRGGGSPRLLRRRWHDGARRESPRTERDPGRAQSGNGRRGACSSRARCSMKLYVISRNGGPAPCLACGARDHDERAHVNFAAAVKHTDGLMAARRYDEARRWLRVVEKLGRKR